MDVFVDNKCGSLGVIGDTLANLTVDEMVLDRVQTHATMGDITEWDQICQTGRKVALPLRCSF